MQRSMEVEIFWVSTVPSPVLLQWLNLYSVSPLLSCLRAAGSIRGDTVLNPQQPDRQTVSVHVDLFQGTPKR